VAIVKALIWKGFTRPERIEDMLRRSESDYANYRKFSLHMDYTENKFVSR
jgi:hypothetical protein